MLRVEHYDDCDFTFGKVGDVILIPAPESLVAAANERFAFFSAEEGLHQGQEHRSGDLQDGDQGQGESGLADLQQRVGTMEDRMQKLAEGMSQLLGEKSQERQAQNQTGKPRELSPGRRLYGSQGRPLSLHQCRGCWERWKKLHQSCCYTLHFKCSCKHALNVFNVMVPENLGPTLSPPGASPRTTAIAGILPWKLGSSLSSAMATSFCSCSYHLTFMGAMEKVAPELLLHLALQMQLQTYIHIYIYIYIYTIYTIYTLIYIYIL